MFSQFFGYFLLHRGYIKPDQLKDVLNYHQNAHIRLGVLAIDAKYMTAEEVEILHNRQAKIDMRFGELAVLQGYLTEHQVERLLSRQKKGHLLLSQALVDLNLMTFSELEKALDDYKYSSGMSDPEFESFKNEDVEAIVEFFINIDGTAVNRLKRDAFILFVKNVIRFVDGGIRFESARESNEFKFEWFASQIITGRHRILTGFAGGEESMLRFAARFAQERISGMNELAIDSVGEFMNYYNGLLISNISNDGLDLTLSPQKVSKNGVIYSSGGMYRIPFYLPFGAYDFIIADSKNMIDK